MLLRELRRQSEVGVIMVTGRDDAVDRIVALELGADDYVTKPYNMRELLPRTSNLARRVAAARQVREDERRNVLRRLDAGHPPYADRTPTGRSAADPGRVRIARHLRHRSRAGDDARRLLGQPGMGITIRWIAPSTC